MAEENKKDPIADFRRLPRAERESIVKAIEETEPTLRLFNFADKVAQQARTERDFIVQLAISLESWFRLLGENPPHYEPMILNYLVTGSTRPADGAEPPDPSIRDHLGRLLRCDHTLGITLKAIDVLGRQQNAYEGAVSTVEVRPIYFADADQPPTFAVAIHQIRLTYQTPLGLQVLYFAMDETQLHQMRLLLERAIAKERSLREGAAYRYL